MNHYVAALIAGLAASLAWAIVNLLADGAFLPVIRRHTDQFNEALMTRPALNRLVLVLDVAFWGALFGLGYELVYPALEPLGALSSGLVWGLVMFASFSRGTIESIVFTKLPRDMSVFFFFEGLAGLVAWGAALGLVFAWPI